jgi:hypothetical protein
MLRCGSEGDGRPGGWPALPLLGLPADVHRADGDAVGRNNSACVAAAKVGDHHAVMGWVLLLVGVVLTALRGRRQPCAASGPEQSRPCTSALAWRRDRLSSSCDGPRLQRRTTRRRLTVPGGQGFAGIAPVSRTSDTLGRTVPERESTSAWTRSRGTPPTPGLP